MDPKGIDGINRLYRQGDIVTRGAHKFAPTAKQIQGGLSNEDFYEEFGDELLVLNGLDYSVNNHSPGARYMATGKLDSMAYPTFAALVAACQGPACPLSFLTFGNYSATGNLVAMSRVPYAQSLRKLANADAVEGNDRSPYHDQFALDRIERALESGALSRAAGPRLPRAEHAENMLFAAQVNSKALQRVTPYIPGVVPKERLSQQADIALAAFKAGVCVSANLSIGQFDSHANNDRDQTKLIPEFLAGIRYLMSRAEKLGIRDGLSSSSRARWAAPPPTTPATARTTGRSGRSCSWAGASRGTGSSAPPTSGSFWSPSIGSPWPVIGRRGSGSARSTSTAPSANSPASPTTRSAGDSRSASPTTKASGGSGADAAPADFPDREARRETGGRQRARAFVQRGTRPGAVGFNGALDLERWAEIKPAVRRRTPRLGWRRLDPCRRGQRPAGRPGPAARRDLEGRIAVHPATGCLASRTSRRTIMDRAEAGRKCRLRSDSSRPT
jgi:hypothetical protein